MDYEGYCWHCWGYALIVQTDAITIYSSIYLPSDAALHYDSLVDDRRIYCVDCLDIFGGFRLFRGFGVSIGRLIDIFKLSRVQCKCHGTLSWPKVLEQVAKARNQDYLTYFICETDVHHCTEKPICR
jgi:hypothetical protein